MEEEGLLTVRQAPVEAPRQRRSIRPLVAAGVLVCGVAALSVMAAIGLGGDVPRDPTSEYTSTSEDPTSGEDDPTPTSGEDSIRPDIVLVMLDDVGLNDLWGSSDIPSALIPTMSMLSTNGVKLTSYYGQSYCSPARATLLSGKFAHKIGFSDPSGGKTELTAFANFSVPLGHVLLPAAMQRLGYATHGIGKWNIGHCNEEYMPWRRGFDTFHGYFTDGIYYTSHQTDMSTYSIEDGPPMNLYDMAFFDIGDDLPRNGSEVRGRYTTEIFNEIAVSQVSDTSSKSPIFMWLAHHGMHDNGNVHDFVLDDAAIEILADNPLPEKRRKFAKGLRVIDTGLGEIVAALQARPRSFVLAVISDNGGSGCGYECAGSNTPHRGMKFFDFDGALKVPGLVYAPDLIEGGAKEFAGMMHHVDWLATFVRLGGGQADIIDHGYDSIDQWDHIASVKGGSARSKIIFSAGANSGTVRAGKYKLMQNQFNTTWLPDNWNGTVVSTPDVCNGGSQITYLFDIESDPYERTDLSHNPKFARVLEDLIQLRISAYQDEYWLPSWPFASPEGPEAPNAAFHANGGYVTHWGCDRLIRKDRS